MDVIDGENELEKQRKKKEPPPDPMAIAARMVELGSEAMKSGNRHSAIQTRALVQIANAFTLIAKAIDRSLPRRPRRKR